MGKIWQNYEKIGQELLKMTPLDPLNFEAEETGITKVEDSSNEDLRECNVMTIEGRHRTQAAVRALATQDLR